MNRLPDRLLVVTDRHQAVKPLPQLVSAALAGGARWIWLRDRDLDQPERRSLAQQLHELVSMADAVLTIGGDVDLAARVGARGVHLQSAGAISAARAVLGVSALIGVSAHDEADVRAAAAAGADYVTVSPIFTTASKPGYGPALGLTVLRRCAAIGLPVVALGGITCDRAPLCIEAGAVGVAVMGEVMRAVDTATTIRSLRACALMSPRAGV
ncbi:thiamine phosphate synthase [Bosea sp. 2YAB26]|uniref:thiamine phosphate synthase n=2 Tax=Pseudomonadota TaxID=1224 RepID=UPI003F92BB45